MNVSIAALSAISFELVFTNKPNCLSVYPFIFKFNLAFQDILLSVLPEPASPIAVLDQECARIIVSCS